MLARRERQKRALELAIDGRGLSYAEIAREMGFKSKGAVHRLIHDALREVPAEALEHYRRYEDLRIEALLSKYMPLAMGNEAKGIAPNLDAARFVDQLIGRRGRLMGINAPEQAPVNKDGETVAGVRFTLNIGTPVGSDAFGDA